MYSLADATKRAFASRRLRLERDTVVDGARLLIATGRPSLLSWGTIERAAFTAAAAPNRVEVRFVSFPRYHWMDRTPSPKLFSALDHALAGLGLGPFPGSRVRMTLVGGSPQIVTGTLVERDTAGALVVQRDHERIVMSRAERAGVAVGRGSYGHPKEGALVGSLLGAVAGALLTPRCDDYVCVSYLSVGAAIGALAGAGLGSIIRTEVWSEVRDP